jgi:hypothetical protein
MQKQTPYLSGVHCMAHRTNLAIAMLSSLKLVSKVESLLAKMYNYFAHSPNTTFGILQVGQNFGIQRKQAFEEHQNMTNIHVIIM